MYKKSLLRDLLVGLRLWRRCVCVQNIVLHVVIAVGPKSKIKRECRYVPVCVMKANEVRDLVSLILILDTRLIFYGELYALAALSPRKNTIIHWRLVEPQGRSGWPLEKRISLARPVSNPGPSSPCLVAIPTAKLVAPPPPPWSRYLEKLWCIWIFPGFARWEKQEDENKCGALVEWYWQGKPELPWEKFVPVLYKGFVSTSQRTRFMLYRETIGVVRVIRNT